jgi:hypothetical protein
LNGDNNQGRVRVFELLNGDWSSIMDFAGSEANDRFGTSVAMSANGMRITAGALGGAGYVQIFKERPNLPWIQVGNTILGEEAYDQFGWSVAMSADGSRVAIGANHYRLETDSTHHGHVRVFDLFETTSTWTQAGDSIDGEACGEKFGWSVAMSADGSRVAVGAPYDNGNAGRVAVYEVCGL